MYESAGLDEHNEITRKIIAELNSLVTEHNWGYLAYANSYSRILMVKNNAGNEFCQVIKFTDLLRMVEIVKKYAEIDFERSEIQFDCETILISIMRKNLLL